MGVRRYRHGFTVALQPDLLDLPRSWREPRLVFVNSMSDLFHEDVPEQFIARVFETMSQCDQHIFQVLTKRSPRLREVGSRLTWPSNVWMGVSVENRGCSDRISDLAATPAHLRFLSCEPLLGDLGLLPLDRIGWVIVGGESGPSSRPMSEDWVMSIQRQCLAAGVPFFFKQWGGVRKHVAGRRLRGRIYDAMPAAASAISLAPAA
jgi:protein gp37